MPKYTVNSYKGMTFSNDTADVDHDNATIEINVGQAYRLAPGVDNGIDFVVEHSSHGLYDSNGHVGDYDSVEFNMTTDQFSEYVDSLIQLREDIRGN